LKYKNESVKEKLEKDQGLRNELEEDLPTALKYAVQSTKYGGKIPQEVLI